MRIRAPFFLLTVLLAAIFLLPLICRGEDSLTLRLERDARVLKGDYKRFYLDPDNIMSLVGVGAVSGIFANTEIDREFQEYYRDDIKSRWTNGASKVLRVPGELVVALPVLFGAHMILDEKTPAGEWADKSLRALLVGGPAGLFIRSLTGASRPNEGGSQWRPFADQNGLIGHAFVGAVPFITAARMQDDPYMKYYYTRFPRFLQPRA